MRGTSWALDPIDTQWSASPLRRDYATYRVLDLAHQRVLAACSQDQPGVDLYLLRPEAPWLSFATTVPLGQGTYLLNGFTFCNTPYLMTYRADAGQFEFFSLDPQLRLTASYRYARSHAPAATRGFTMVRPFELADGVMFMGYGFDTGAVCMYRIAGVVFSKSGAPPIAAHTVWEHVWAPGWTRFAFFTLGLEVFFLKTNVKFPNVNIDHVLDSPEQGTSEVCTQMPLADAQTLTIVEPFALAIGHPHFIAYRADGRAIIYRIHSDCQGWTSLVTAQIPPNAIALQPALAGAQGHTFIHISEG